MDYERMILFKYIMKSWKLLWKEEVSDEKKSYSLKIKVFKVLLCFKDKESDETFDESISLC